MVWSGSLGDWRLGGGVTAVFAAVRHTPTSRDDSISVKAPFTRFEFSTEILVQGEYVALLDSDESERASTRPPQVGVYLTHDLAEPHRYFLKADIEKKR